MVAIWVGKLAVAFAPELVVQWHGDLGACVDSLVPDLLDVASVDVQCDRTVAEHIRGLRTATWEGVG